MEAGGLDEPNGLLDGSGWLSTDDTAAGHDEGRSNSTEELGTVLCGSIVGSPNGTSPSSFTIDTGGISFAIVTESFRSRLAGLNDVSELLVVENSESLRITSSEPGEGNSDPANVHSSIGGERLSDSMINESTEITLSRREKVGDPFDSGSKARATSSDCAVVLV